MHLIGDDRSFEPFPPTQGTAHPTGDQHVVTSLSRVDISFSRHMSASQQKSQARPNDTNILLTVSKYFSNWSESRWMQEIEPERKPLPHGPFRIPANASEHSRAA
jgi:hypothetical protein